MLPFAHCYRSANPVPLSLDALTHFYGLFISFSLEKRCPFFGSSATSFQIPTPADAGIHSEPLPTASLLSKYVTHK